MMNSKAFPDSLVLGRESNLIIGQLETLHELQIRTVSYVWLLGQTNFKLTMLARRLCLGTSALLELAMTQ